MANDRPNPDLLLAQVQAAEARQARGKLKIFFGAAPGVGKTYAMLEAGRKAAKEGIDVVVGYLEPHARPETQGLVLGLDMLARREIAYRGQTLLEFHLEAALARRPQLLLVDELAHSNAEGSIHAKRWQDVEDLLDAGIDVYTTLNVQHLETLKDVIAEITGIAVRETVPDSVFERANEVELVDLAPDDLIERLKEGKVYFPDRALHALENFFRKGNLIALRELALRRMAERVDAQMDAYRREPGSDRISPTSDRLLVCVGPSPHSARLVRAARRMAANWRAPWVVAHVETGADARLTPAERDRLSQTLHLAEQLGAETATLSGTSFADEIMHFAHSRNITKILVGKPQQPRWREWLRGSFVYELTRKCGDIDIYVISGDAAGEARERRPATTDRFNRRGLIGAGLMVLLATAVCWSTFLGAGEANLIMIYLLSVVASAVWLGRGPSVLAAVLSVAAFDFFFIPPYFTFAISDTKYLLTFAGMLLTGLIISTLTARVRFQANSARERERRTAALYAMSRELVDAATVVQLAQSAQRHVGEVFGGKVCVLVSQQQQQRNAQTMLVEIASSPESASLPERELGVAQWVFDHGNMAGRGTDTLPFAAGVYLPLATQQGCSGVLGLQPAAEAPLLTPEQLRLLQTFAGQIALALERIRASLDARELQVQMESERLRNSLLSAVSHDLRTPLAAITGASSTLVDNGDRLSPATRQELAESIYLEGDRLNRLVTNLLDMTRLEAGALTLHKEWQPLEEVVGVALGRLDRLLQGRQVTAQLSPELPLVPIDGLLLQQVFVNLLENAIKYSPAGSPIDISARSHPEGVLVEVADRGPGIPVEERGQIFERFVRMPTSGARLGTGLGLAICQGIVKLHGGRLWVDERPGGGALFRFTLPLTGSPPELPEVLRD